MAGLFDPIEIKGLNLKNRIMMSSMCQYKAENSNGIPTDWHYIHYVSRAIGGTGLIFMEMTNVESKGRITEGCLGLWSEKQGEAFKKIIAECHKYGSRVGIQIAHAGRKSTIKGEKIVAPSPNRFSEDYMIPHELTKDEIESIINKFGETTKLAVKTGIDVIELHAAHGYLIHQFISPQSNFRKDEYGDYGLFAKRIIKKVKKNMPENMPLFMRISAVEYHKNGYGFDHILKLIPEWISAGVDGFDVSTGGNDPVRPEVYPAYQTKYSFRIREMFQIPTISVGNLENTQVAESVIRSQSADIVAIGKGLLRNPYWAKEAADSLSVSMELPGVYNMGFN